MGCLLFGTWIWAAHSESWNSKGNWRTVPDSRRLSHDVQHHKHTPSHTTPPWRANYSHHALQISQDHRMIRMLKGIKTYQSVNLHLKSTSGLCSSRFFVLSNIRRKIRFEKSFTLRGVGLGSDSLRKQKRDKKRSLKRTQQRSFVFFLHLGVVNWTEDLTTWLVLFKKNSSNF